MDVKLSGVWLLAIFKHIINDMIDIVILTLTMKTCDVFSPVFGANLEKL